MAEGLVCQTCGEALSADAVDGLCARCQPPARATVPSPSPAFGPSTVSYRGPFQPPTPAELAPHFSHLEILELLGQGGMGAVYKARHRKLDRLVAVKILPPALEKDPSFAERFTREARALAKLSHPGIVGVYDFGETGGLFYFLMEFVDGGDLRQAIRSRSVDPARALELVCQVCDALQYAHEEGVVHRDVKPENLLIDRKGRVKVADFGLAKLLGRSPADYTLTQTHQVMGTPLYMAPEQRERPQEVDHRADVYSLGVVAYELLTGEVPLGHFAAPSQKAAVDSLLDAVILRALAREPERRYQQVCELKRDLEGVTAPKAVATTFDIATGGNLQRPDKKAARPSLRGVGLGLLLTGFSAVLFWTIILVWQGVTFYESSRSIKTTTHLSTGGGYGGTFEMSPTPTRIFHLFSFLIASVGATLGGVIIASAFQLKKYRAYRSVYFASVLVMLPWYPFFVFGIPVGICAVMALWRPEVKAAFGVKPRPMLPRSPDLIHPLVRPDLIHPLRRLATAEMILLGVLLPLNGLLITFVIGVYNHSPVWLLALRFTLICLAGTGAGLSLVWWKYGRLADAGSLRAPLRRTPFDHASAGTVGLFLSLMPLLLVFDIPRGHYDEFLVLLNLCCYVAALATVILLIRAGLRRRALGGETMNQFG